MGKHNLRKNKHSPCFAVVSSVLSNNTVCFFLPGITMNIGHCFVYQKCPHEIRVYLFLTPGTAIYSDLSRLTPDVKVITYYFSDFLPENCMKLKKNCTERGASIAPPPLKVHSHYAFFAFLFAI